MGLPATMGLVAAGLVATQGIGLVPRSLVAMTIDAVVLVLLAYAAFRRLARLGRQADPSAPFPG
ncbi:hypothetical protein [Streptosporangium canum]|uniref:hypothetical protein n=1 Tax=Streptosporangium canum TaxID=324952 RepID=UPI00378B98FA